MRVVMMMFAAFAFAAPAFALEPGDVVGQWTTEWSEGAKQAVSGGGPMFIARDSAPDMLDGHTPAPGMDGIMSGEASAQANGDLVWTGAWASVWPEGATMGTFRMVFTDADTFTGTWSSNDGEIDDAIWNGHRAR